MRKPSMLGNACGLAALGLSPFALAGEETAAVEAQSANPWTFEAALLYLEARGENYRDQDEEVGYRFSLGYQPSGSNWGYRFRFMDHEATNRSGKFDTYPETTSYELEGFQALSLGAFEGEWSIGLRYLDLTQHRVGPVGPRVEFEGIGPVIGIDLTQEITENYSLYVNGRASFLFGDDDRGNAADNTGTIEAGLGIQRSLSLGGIDGSARLGIEAHRFFELDANEDDADLLGGVFSIRFGF